MILHFLKRVIYMVEKKGAMYIVKKKIIYNFAMYIHRKVKKIIIGISRSTKRALVALKVEQSC